MKPGKLEKITTGMVTVYASQHENKSDVFSKLCELVEILNISRREAALAIHTYRPVRGGRLRVKWAPVFVEDELTC